MIRRTDTFSGEVFTPKRNNQNFASRKKQVDYNNAMTRGIIASQTEIDSQVSKSLIVF